jgi:hypothetical protein
MTTDIDTQKCKRVAPIQLLCLGLGRTGTSCVYLPLSSPRIRDYLHSEISNPVVSNAALERALEILGYNDIYKLESVTTACDVDLWVKAMDAKYEGKGPFGRKEWDQLLGHYSVH